MAISEPRWGTRGWRRGNGTAAICADGGHRPGLHPEPRQAARPRGGASREVGSPHGRWRPIIAPYRNGTAAICADCGHRPGFHPEHRQAARQRGGASREGGSPHGRWRGVTAPKRRGARGAHDGHRPGLHPEPRQAAWYGNAPYCHAARQRRTRGAHDGRGSGGGRALLMAPHNRSAGGEIGVFSVVTKGIRPEYVFSSHRRSTSSVSGLLPLTISPVSHSVLFPSMPEWDIFLALPLWRQRAG